MNEDEGFDSLPWRRVGMGDWMGEIRVPLGVLMRDLTRGRSSFSCGAGGSKT